MKTYFKNLEAAKAKLELRKLEKVELGLIDDFQKKLSLLKDYDNFFSKRLGKLRNEYLKARGIALEVKDLYQDSKDDVGEAKDIIKETEVLVDKLVKAAKELGIDVKDIKGTKDVVKLVANIEDDIDTFEKTENDYKELIKAI